LLKFEFFFQEKHAFLKTLEEALARLDPAWRTSLQAGTPAIQGLLEHAPTLCSDMMLRAFLESYLVVADELVERPGAIDPSDASLLEVCEARAARYLEDRTLRHRESASRYLFGTALQLAGHRGLLSGGSEALAGRDWLADELRGLLQHMDTVHRIAVCRVLEAVWSRPG